MDSRACGFVAAGSFLLAFLCGGAGSARHADSEEDLLARIQRENDPVRKAKYEIRLGRVKLEQAIDAYDQGHLEQCQKLLAAYLERMRGSWETLRSSGRRASRHPQGFKELDIALREDGRLLDDLKRRIPALDRGPAEKTAQEVEELRSEVLRVLFPAERTGNALVPGLTEDPAL
jgi:hypothetical protein